MAAVAGCGRSRSAERGNVLRIPLPIDLTSIDPALAADPYSIDTTQNAFEGLVAMGEDNRAHPCLATSSDVSKDGKTYTFHVRRGVKFQDGRAFEASDVVRSFERACGPSLDAPLAGDFLGDISGMAAYHSGKAAHLAGIRAVDARTIRITLDAPHPYFIAKLTCPVACIVDCAAIKDGVHIRSLSEMAGTGPFRFTGYQEGQRITLAAFDGYWGGRPKIDGIERPIIADENARINAFKRGEIDVVPQVDRADFAALRSDPATESDVRLVDRATLVYLALNTQAWSDRRVRRAIAMAIDRRQIADDTLSGTVTPACGVLPPAVPGYRLDPGWIPPDAAKARALLAEAGHPAGKGLPEVIISFAMENPDMERIADRVGAQIHAMLGLPV
ncbi:MAG TPA: ABC transporter substrate-binding protein, partial [Fimbriimonadaceae bacterium]|nr:ABC transporter substrate-binding protein [Fimbriimonadaceae bacterium]